MYMLVSFLSRFLSVGSVPAYTLLLRGNKKSKGDVISQQGTPVLLQRTVTEGAFGLIEDTCRKVLMLDAGG
jgi:hypothetical protein